MTALGQPLRRSLAGATTSTGGEGASSAAKGGPTGGSSVAAHLLNAAMASQEVPRDIDLVLVTGAGASREFGVNHTQLPLMDDWARALVAALNGHPGYRRVTGLEAGMDGPEFEARLGDFLRRVQAFRLMEPLLEALAAVPSAQSQVIADGAWSSWHSDRSFQLGEITKVIHKSLYDQFGEPSTDPGMVQQGYSTLLTSLGIGPNSRWAIATTNYDTIAEQAVEAVGGMPDTGSVQLAKHGTQPRRPRRATGWRAAALCADLAPPWASRLDQANRWRGGRRASWLVRPCVWNAGRHAARFGEGLQHRLDCKRPLARIRSVAEPRSASGSSRPFAARHGACLGSARQRCLARGHDSAGGRPRQSRTDANRRPPSERDGDPLQIRPSTRWNRATTSLGEDPSAVKHPVRTMRLLVT
jgi:hypothetical protein